MARRARPRAPRTRSIRTTLTALLVVAVVALVGLWAVLADFTVGNALLEYKDHRITSELGTATDKLLLGLENERAQTFIWLSSGQRTPTKALTASRRADDAAVATYERLYPTDLPSRHPVMVQLGKIAAIRTVADVRTLSATGAFQDFSGIVNGLLTTLLAATVPNVTVEEHILGDLDMGQALLEFGGELTLSAAAEFDGGRLPAPVVALFAGAVADQQQAIQNALTQGDPQLVASLRQLYNTPLHRSVAKLEQQIAGSAGHPAIATLLAWAKQAPAFLQQFEHVATAAAVPVAAEAGQVSRDLFIEAGLAAGLGLVAIVGVALLMLRFGRRIRTELTGLHDGAEAMATERLPALVDRLSSGEDVDVVAASPPLPTGRITEIARVADAFSAVQRTAADAAVGQANLRKGVSKVFVNLSLRNQAILHRQLGMLDALERGTDDPVALADLFRLDHLTTRMRRHAESLIILSGTSTGRSWREPVPLVDVLRAAMAEVEDYTRIEVAGQPAGAVVGPAANDVVHLLAELMENATSFSPPNTRVETRVEEVGAGVAVEVEDRGLGLTKSELTAINARLASPPGFDLVASEHLGLFVVGQLAARHGISVALRRSHYGGVIAVVVLPHTLVVRHAESAPALTGVLTPAPASLRAGNGSVLSLPGSYLPDDTPNLSVGDPPGAAAVPYRGRDRGPFEPLRYQEQGTEQFRHDAQLPRPRQETAAAAAPVSERDSWSVPGDTYRGLPRRVRQASLPRQLHNGRDAVPSPEASDHEVAPGSPELTRSKMSSLQDGWQRGREAELDWPGDLGTAPGRPSWGARDGDSA
jgi:hypothetical protein